MPDEDEIRDPSTDAGQDYQPAPRWVKVWGLIVIVVLIVIAIVLVTGVGGHGPGRHSQIEQGTGALSVSIDAATGVVRRSSGLART